MGIGNGYFRFVRRHTSKSERYAEAFYGIVMVTGCTGMVSLAIPTEASVMLMMGTAILVNVLWGIIDGLTVIFGGLVDDIAEDEAVKAWRVGTGGSKDVIDGFDDSLVGVLEESDQEEIAGIIREAGGYEPMKAGLGRHHLSRFLAIFSIDFFAVFWIILPYMLTTNVADAARASLVIATAIMFFLGYRWAKYARMRKVAVGVAFSLFTLVLLAISHWLGGV